MGDRLVKKMHTQLLGLFMMLGSAIGMIFCIAQMIIQVDVDRMLYSQPIIHYDAFIYMIIGFFIYVAGIIIFRKAK